MLPHLTNGWQVDQAIQHEEDKVSFGLIIVRVEYSSIYDVIIRL